MVAEPASDDTSPTRPGEPTRPDQPSDKDLLAAHVAGDTGAFAELVARHRDRLWAIALRTTGNPDDAADGLQDAFVSAYRRAGTYRGEAAVTTWLHRVVVNACLDRLRAASARRTEPLPDDLEEYGGRGSIATSGPAAGPGRLPGGAGAAGAGDDPAEASVRGERRREVLAALMTLPAEQRAAIVLVDMEGYRVAEAAAILGCATGTVKSRCSRGRARLARRLAHLLVEDPRAPVDQAGNPGEAPDVGTHGARGPPRPR